MGRARGRPRKSAAKKAPAKLSQRLVLSGWMLRLFEVGDAETLLADLASVLDGAGPSADWVGPDGVTWFHRRLTSRMERAALSHTDLLRYDENIVRHWREMTAPPERRNLELKHFQYAALLFAEVYLDRYFRDEDGLLADLNAFVDEWNEEREEQDQADTFAREDLNKLAFWMATGSGMTLLMHVNIKQYLHYHEAAGKRHTLNRIILLTPNDGLSRQHLDEFLASGMEAELFTKEGRTLFTGRSIEIIDIHKLAEESKEKTVAVDAFEGNNLVLVDEGHRGASASEAGVWMDRRRRLCEDGFSFEYSATFGQAMKTTGSRMLLQEYGHAILFDYSYRYFHADGFGKEFQILNLKEDQDADQRRLYMTGGLLAFLQQLRLHRDHRPELARYLLEKPLWVFVGSRVTASTGVQELSDIQQILAYLDDFVRDRTAAVRRIGLIQSGNHALVDGAGRNIFANRLALLFSSRTAEQIYDEALTLIFNGPAGGTLRIEQLRGADAEGEIALSIGDHDAFGVINVGDASKVVKQAEDHGITVAETGDFKESLFRRINTGDSSINVLIGAKKFTEGWSSWRVSTMGLMNVGKSEGSEIIQLFGRGVRLRGLDFSLKRSTFVRRDDGEKHPPYLRHLETLNVFGIQADYMQQFGEFLEEEGVPTDDDIEEITLDVINHLAKGGKFEHVKLWTLKLPSDIDFKRTGPKPVLEATPHELVTKYPIALDWYPRIQTRRSRGLASGDGDAVTKTPRPLTADHIAFFDFDEIWFALQRFKAERSWHNLAIPRGVPRALLEAGGWYALLIPAADLDFTDFERVRVWQEIAVALLKKYIERYYRLRQTEYEKDHLRYEELQPDDGNFFEHYPFRVPSGQEDVRDALVTLRDAVANGSVTGVTKGPLQALAFDRHLYVPLIHLTGEIVEVTPVALNRGERDFVEHLAAFLKDNAAALGGREVYLLRNQSRGKGVGFFEAGGFYPDFLLWVKQDTRQHIAFVDPKGLRNLDGPNDPKIRLAASIKEHESRLREQNSHVALDAFLISETPYHQLQWASAAITRDDLEGRHVLFPDEGGGAAHIRQMFELMGELATAS